MADSRVTIAQFAAKTCVAAGLGATAVPMACGDDSIDGANETAPEQACAQPDDFARAGIELVEDEGAMITFVGPAGLAIARRLRASLTWLRTSAIGSPLGGPGLI